MGQASSRDNPQDLERLKTLLKNVSRDLYMTDRSGFIQSMKSALRTAEGRAYIVAHPSALNLMSEYLVDRSCKHKIDVFEVLTHVCFLRDGHKKVLEALYRQEFVNRKMFQIIIRDLERSTGHYRTDISIKIAITSFLNAILSYGPSAVFRCRLRSKLSKLGLETVVDNLRQLRNETLDRHLDFLNQMAIYDEKDIGEEFDHTVVSPEKTRQPGSNSTEPGQNTVVQQSWTQLESASNAHPQEMKDVTVLEEQQSVTVPSPPPQNPDPPNGLSFTVTPLAPPQNPEPTNGISPSVPSPETPLPSPQNPDPSNGVSSFVPPPPPSLPTPENPDPSKRVPSFVPPPPPPLPPPQNPDPRNGIPPFVPPPPPPLPPPQKPDPPNGIPPPPPMPGIADPPPPPPPPAFVGSLPPRIPSEATKKLNQIKIPESTTQLKALNWSKLPITKLQETLWLKVDISKVYEQLNLQEIDELFEAFKHNIPTVKEAGAQVSKQPSKEKISVIDKQRAQNCMILLKTIKMTGDEITSVLLSMDQYNQLPIDRIEQLLKLAPSEKEKERLEEQDLHWLDTADAFFFRISRIQHYSERLHALQYTKKFPVIASELRSNILTVTKALEELNNSKKLIQLLEIVLAIGNYMNNKGTRGNAVGFRLTSLLRIQDTKSNSTNCNLINFLITQIEKFWPDVLEIESELMNLKAAASMNIGDLEKTLRDLSSGMKLILKEIEFHESIELEEGDNFLISMGKFTVTAENQLREIENSYSAMEAKFRQTRRYFGEDEYTPADEFLQVFDQFFQNFRGARSENENLRKKKEEERKRAENPRLKRTNSASVSSSFTELGELQNLLVSKKTK